MRLNVREWGQPGHPTAVLLHGITANAGAWVAMGPALAARGMHVLAPELRGHGDTPARAPYDPTTLLGDIADSVPTAPDLLVGHSFGGFLAQRGVLDGTLRPRAMVLEDPVSHQPDAELPAAMLEHDRTSLPRSVDGILALNPRWSRLDAAWKVLSLEQVDWSAATAAFATNAPWDLRADAGAVARLVPTVWVLPGESRFVPSEDRAKLVASVGQDRVIVADAAGHSIHRDEPELFLATIDALLQETGQ